MEVGKEASRVPVGNGPKRAQDGGGAGVEEGSSEAGDGCGATIARPERCAGGEDHESEGVEAEVGDVAGEEG